MSSYDERPSGAVVIPRARKWTKSSWEDPRHRRARYLRKGFEKPPVRVSLPFENRQPVPHIVVLRNSEAGPTHVRLCGCRSSCTRATELSRQTIQREGAMRSKSLWGTSVVLVCSLVLAACHDSPSAPANDGAVRASAPPRSLVNYGDPCFSDASMSCYDGTTAGGILDGSQYGSLGGFASCYDGTPGGCGSGFGGWEAVDNWSCPTPTSYTFGCVTVAGKGALAWLGCPTQISFQSINIITGGMDTWTMTFQYTWYWGSTVKMGNYSGTYRQPNGQEWPATGKMVCGAGWIATSSTHF